MHAAALGALLGASVARAAPLGGERDLSSYTYEQYEREFPARRWSSLATGWTAQVGELRQSTFESNLAVMRAHNADANKTWFAAPNEFTDWTNDEFRAARTSRPSGGRGDATAGAPLAAQGAALPAGLPDSVDWRSKGVVTPVKNQGGCGSCWAFSAVETLESFLAIEEGAKEASVLSEQQVVSCMANPEGCGGSGGCAGATQGQAFNYTSGAGLSLESDYPYQGSGSCSASKTKPYAKNDGFVKLKVNDYNDLMTAVATKGPIAISIAAGSFGWQLYGGGVFGGGGVSRLSGCGYDQDHGVQLVGYGTDSGKDYWLVRNSWGAGWGEHGYMRIIRYGDGKEPCGVDKTPQDGEGCRGDTKPRTYCGFCGIMGSSTYPTGARKVHPSASTGILV